MGNRFKKPFFNKDETAHHEWYERFLTTPDHELSVEDYIGPFPVGPLGYREDDVQSLSHRFDRSSRHAGRDMIRNMTLSPIPVSGDGYALFGRPIEQELWPRGP